MDEFWLIMHPDTFIWTKGNSGIVYNSRNYQSFTFSNRKILKNISRTLVNPDNLYGIILNSEQLSNLEVNQFIGNVKVIQAGVFLEKKSNTPRPVSYPPMLKIQEDISALRFKHKSGTQTNEILRNLTEITIHVNGDPNYNPLYYKQFMALSDSSETLSVNDLKQFLDKCCKEYIITLNLVGDFATYQERKALFEWIKNTNFNRYHLITSLGGWLSHPSTPECSKDNSTIRQTVIVENVDLLKKTDITQYLQNNTPITFCFPVDSEHEYYRVNEIIHDKEIKLFEIVPIFNENNLDFFQSYVYTTLEDVRFSQFNRRKIFSNQVINNFFFGKLIILPNKNVYANVNAGPIGKIEDSIYRLIFNELDSGTSWRMIRNKKPCTKCLYQWLCPSPSNYELLIGRPNLCEITLT
ncbi:MAG: TIGR04150 pseudo-rSAM protein [Bacteroidales bacterium]